MLGYQLSIGDIVVDNITKETGILLRRHFIQVDCDWDEYVQDDDKVWAWDIFWTGTAVHQWQGPDRITTYTEEGLLLIIGMGVLRHQKTN